MAFPADYTKYQEVTVDNTKVSADLTDYVIYIDLADLDKAGSDIFDTCRSDGGDIRVTKSDGTTELAREVVHIDTTGKTGELHVKFTGTLSSSVDTTIRVWYNGTDTEPAVTATYGRNNVWTDYELVYHGQDSSGTTITSSTGSNNGTASNARVNSNTEAGKLSGEALDFGDPDNVNTNYAPPINNYTAQAWIKFDTVSSDASIFDSGWFRAVNSILLYMISGTTLMAGGSRAGSSPVGQWSSSNTVTTGTWYHMAFYGDGSNVGFIRNGSADGTPVSFSSTGTSGRNLFLGFRESNSSTYFDGAMDEVRFRTEALSTNWLTTEYNNQNSPSTFYSTGDEVDTGGGATNNALFFGAGF